MATLTARPQEKLTIKHKRVLDAYFAERINDPKYEGEKNIYTVKSGDSISKIANKKGTTVSDIIVNNTDITSANKHLIKVGQKINITKQTKIGDKVTFKKLDSANLGDEVYVIVETENLSDVEVCINVKQGKTDNPELEKDSKGMFIAQEGNNDISLAKATVGAYGNDSEITNKDDFANWAIFKITLGARHQEDIGEALEKLDDKKAFLFLVVDAHTRNKIDINYDGQNEDDETTFTNRWLDIKGKWFELNSNKRAPWMEIAYKELGTEEIEGKKHNSRVLEYHKSAGVEDYKNRKGQTVKITDDKGWPWCSSFVCWVFDQTPKFSGKITAKATNWKNWGTASSKDKPMYGALAVIDWGINDNKAGHVGFVVNADDDNYYLLGGNQTGGDKTTNGKVCIGKYKKSVIDYIRIPNNYKPTENDYNYDEIKSSNNGFESLSSTR